jgi:hypothetical protein
LKFSSFLFKTNFYLATLEALKYSSKNCDKSGAGSSYKDELKSKIVHTSTVESQSRLQST